ncbi:MAG TPA: hypothetical protein VFW67_03465, partial [Burkholderiaceae bacterium]|nr:hypothetical protein [Burkholderiaceae bacterium]
APVAATAARAIRVFFIERFSKVEKRGRGHQPQANLRFGKLLLLHQNLNGCAKLSRHLKRAMLFECNDAATPTLRK